MIGVEILLGVERQVLVERDVRRNLQIVQQQRVAVRRRVATRLVAMMVPPPLTFSTMTFCFSLFDSDCASTRATWSVGPPAG